ncbi:hypothetical protein N7451_000826 [Penicillium sp. IBT 35674x]|nr:hypothetical protein N7451_000826 [Penicillium sp. IBT 35674x]
MLMDSFTPSPLPAKVLMLHGHGQSGQFFEGKTRFLQPHLRDMILKASQSDNTCISDSVESYYPSGVLPGNPDQPEGDNTRVWGYGDRQVDRLKGLDQSISYVMDILETEGPFIGVVGFSTGAALAAIITSLLEKRKSVCGFNFDTTHPPLKFAVCCSGFMLGSPWYTKLYRPRIETPILHVIALMDNVVEPKESMQLVKFCKNGTLYSFFGTHYVPRSPQFVEKLADFVSGALDLTEIDGDWEDC